MLELPDVECLRKCITTCCLDRKIVAINVGDETVLVDEHPASFRDQVVGSAFVRTLRRGRHVFIELSTGRWIVLYFGDRGYLRYGGMDWSVSPEQRLAFAFDGDFSLACVDDSFSGYVTTTCRPSVFARRRRLGPDALDPALEVDTFIDLMYRTPVAVKSALMDQTLVSGIGDIYSDEILFQARIHPVARTTDLPRELLAELYRAMRDVLETASEACAQVDLLPDSYATRHRHTDHTCPVCGERMRLIHVAGKTCHTCVNCQKLKA